MVLKNKKQKIYKRNKEVEKYFEEHGLGTWNRRAYTERYHIYQIEKLFDKHFFEREPDFEFNWDVFFNELIEIKSSLRYMFNKLLKYSGDYKRNYDISKMSREFIEGEICYINSKWRCSHRVEFLYSVAEYFDNLKGKNK